MNDAQFTEKFGATQESLDEVAKFAKDHNLQLSEANLSSGRVVLKGTAGQFSDAFDTKLNTYDLNGNTYTGREGSLMIPNSMANHIEGVFGLDERPQARSYAVKLSDLDLAKAQAIQGAAGPAEPGDGPPSGRGPIDPKRASGYMPNEVADAYNFPKGTTGKGGGVAIVELGGGIDLNNEAAYYKAHGLKMPDIKTIELGNAKNQTGGPADGEVALDSQVIGAVAPDAKQTIIFGENSDQGFMDAITRGSFPEKGETPNQAISISWGGPIENWTDQGKRGMNLAFKKAALKGISVFAASGDDGAVDNAQSGQFNTDYPAADPDVMGTGGTRLTIKNGQITGEVAWNNGEGRGAGGGGISPDGVPDYQKGLEMPPNANGTGVPGRGVPDIAGDADPVTGYKIRVNGTEQVIGGTSAVAPLYAALALRLNEGLGKPVGFLNPFFYKNGMAGTAPFFNDIVSGNNNGYNTGKGWDAVTGWGSVDGEKLLSALKGDNLTFGARLSNAVPLELKTPSDLFVLPMNVHAPATIASTSDNKKAG
jgi:kumamolisin